MTLEEIAAALVAGCRDGTEEENLGRLYSSEAISVEPHDMGRGRKAMGLAGIREKHAWWAENFEVHGGEVEGPFLHGPDRFAVIFTIDATHKASGERMQSREIGLYHVAGGRIVLEEFFATS